MKKTILTIAAAIFALSGAVSCTDYLYEGTVDLTPKPEEPFDYPTEYTFNHPCALVNADDIARVKTHVEAADESDLVYASWKHLCANSLAQPTVVPDPKEILVRGDVKGTGVASQNYISACRDAASAFQLGIRWQVTGDKQYAKKAAEILNAWAATCHTITSNDNDNNLLAGFQGYQFANAAELIRDYDGWTEEEQNTYKQWMRNLWYAKNYWFISEHGGANVCTLHYWANWELANLASIMAIGIYLEDFDMINFVYKNFREGLGSGCINNFIPYEPIPDPDVEGCMIAQSMESGRDNGHATLVVSICSELCRMADNIGLDFFGMDNNKVLAMCEYTAKWNARPEGSFLATTMPFTEYRYCTDCTCRDKNHGAIHTEVAADEGRGTIRPCWDLIYNHYKSKGVNPAAYHYTELFAKQLRTSGGQLVGDGGAGDSRYGSNSSAYDQVGWGSLLFTRD